MIEGLKPYSDYRPSSLRWLGNIPSHWHEELGCSVFREKQEKNTGLRETQILSLSYGRIVVKNADKLHGLVPDSFETYQIVNPGDVVIRGTDLQNDTTSLRVGLVCDRGIITSAYLCLRGTQKVLPEYSHLLLHAYDLRKFFYGLGSGLRQNLSFGDFKRLPFPVPPTDEQVAIVRFLDHANRRIDRYIHSKRKLIALLNEQKQAIVQQAVMRGLDPNAPIRDSGVHWLGKVPAHWVVRRAKYLFREVDERSETGSEELLSVSHLTGITPRSQKNVTMFKARSYINHKLCRSGDLVVNTMWAWMGALGVSVYSGIVSPAYAVYRPYGGVDVDSAFVDLLLRTSPYVSHFIRHSTGLRASRLRLYPEAFLRTPILLPPPGEQRGLVDSVRAEVGGLEDGIATAERQVGLVREYRMRLIADVVTGQLDVREAARSLPDLGSEELEAEPTESENDGDLDDVGNEAA